MREATLAVDDESSLQQSNLHPPELSKSIVWDMIVIGAGPAGARFIKKIREMCPAKTVLWFNAEPYTPYNRIKLSELLACSLSSDFLQDEHEDSFTEDDTLFLQFGCRVHQIIPEKNQIIDSQQRAYQYENLILATGSRPHIPNVPGHDLKGVYTFRDYADAEALKARLCHSRQTVIIGGGLLGIEAACAMQQDSTKIALVQQGNYLMNKQLDEVSGGLLTEHIKEKDIRVFTGSGLNKVIEKHGRVIGVELKNGVDIPCDTVVLTTGIRPNKEIALNAGLKVGQGIRTNIYMQTSHENIYAIGECAEFNGEVHGLVAPGLEQASVAACHIAGTDAQYLGVINSAQLKVANQPVLSVGTLTKEGHPLREEIAFITEGKNESPRYAKIILHANHIIGAINYGSDKQFNRLQQAVQQNERIWPWQLWRFKKTGYLWPEAEADDIATWPDQTHVCQCMNITKGELTSVVLEQSLVTMEELSSCTGAGTVCGSCKPLLTELVGKNSETETCSPYNQEHKEKNGKALLFVFSLLSALLLSLWFALPPFDIRDSWSGFHLSDIWTDGLYKQITGFTMLGLVSIGLLLSLRKRTQFIPAVSFISLRSLHILSGCCALGILLLHTGLNAGSNMNLLLLTSFLGASILGVLTATGIGFTQNSRKQTLRKLLSQLHIFITWPLPFLLAFHILSVYWF